MKTYQLWMRKFARDRNGVASLVILLILLVCALLASVVAPYPPTEINPRERLQPPSWRHLFGTDNMGKDILSRIIYGTRLSLLVAGTTVLAATAIGTLVGLLAGYYEGWLGMVLMRLADVFVSLPRIVMALVIVAALGPGIRNVILALTVTYWPFWSRIVYTNVISLKKSPFMEATRGLGASAPRIIFLHLLPNTLPDLITRTTISLGGTILASAVLSYVGLGAQPPTADWGLDLSIAREYLPNAWWYALFPGLAILLTVMVFNMLGDALRDVLDPKLRVSRDVK